MREMFVGIALALSLAVVSASGSPTVQTVKTTGRGATLFASIKSPWIGDTSSGSNRKLLGGLASRLSYGHGKPSRQVQERGHASHSSGPDSWQYWGGGRDFNDRLWQRQPWVGGGGWSGGGGGWSEDRWNRFDNVGSGWDNSGSSWDSGSWDNSGGWEDSWDRRRA